MRVLAIDDEADARNLVANILTQYQAEVLAVASATEALAAIASFQPTLIISDIGMPKTDGYALIQQIRALPDEQGGNVPAIALTAYASEGDQERAIAAGFQAHLAKPVEPKQLIETVMALMRQDVD